MAGRWSNLTQIIALVALGCASQKPTADEAISDPWAKVSKIASNRADSAVNPADGDTVSRASSESAKKSDGHDVVTVDRTKNQLPVAVRRLPKPLGDTSSEVRQVEFELSGGDDAHKSRSTALGNPAVVEDLPANSAEQLGKLDRDATTAVPIDFPTALAVAAGDNPQVAFARQRINEAYAQAMAANAMWIPSLRAGMSWNKHEGTIQDVEGNLIETSRGSAYAGFGADAVGAGSPAVPGLVVDMRLRDAIFRPRIADQLLGASRQASRATTNDILFNAASAYNDLLEAMAYEAVTRTTLNNSIQLTEVTADFARIGQGLISDADRALAEQSVAEIEVRRAVEGVQTASVRLARILSEDPTLQLVPQEATLVPVDLTCGDCSVRELVATGLSNRPELAESRFLVGAAVERLRSERSAPYIPSMLLGLSYGGFGAGLGNTIEGFDDRMDFDAVAYWEVRNLGLGEAAARDEATSRVQQARWRQVQIMDQVASEVAEAHLQVVSRRDQIRIAERGITAAQESHRRNSERIKDALGLPIEALQSIQALDRAQGQYVRSVADYNRAQFELQRALGWAIQGVDAQPMPTDSE
jgi:outer membrane protein TolC